MSVSEDEVSELLGDRADESIVERIAQIDANIDDVREALDDVDFELRFGEEREASSPVVDEIRRILEEMPPLEGPTRGGEEDDADDEVEGLSIIGAEELMNHGM